MAPIHDLARTGDIEGLRALLDCGDLLKAREIAEMRDGHKRTALHLASFFGYAECVEFLVQFSDANGEASDGYIALHFASQRGHDKVVRTLLRHSRIDRKTYKGMTPFHLACMKASAINGHGDVARLLISKGCDTAIKSKQGKTGLDLVQDVSLRSELEELMNNSATKRKRSHDMSKNDFDSPNKLVKPNT